MKLPITLSYDDFISLTTTMLDSNPHIVISVEWHWLMTINSKYTIKYSAREDEYVTITSIEVTQPVFNVWDTVMIVDTDNDIHKVWDIKVIKKVDWNICRFKWKNYLFWSYFNQLVKIPHDLLHKLQD